MISYSTISSNWRYIINRKQTTTLRIIFDETYGNKDSFAKSRASIDDRTRVCVYVCVCVIGKGKEKKNIREEEKHKYKCNVCTAHICICVIVVSLQIPYSTRFV